MADSANVFIAAPPQAAGTFYHADLGTTAPTDASTAPDNAFADLGYVGEEGYTNARTRDTTDLKAFGGDTVGTTQNSYDETVAVTLIEDSNPEVAKVINGAANVDTATAGVTAILHNKLRLPRECFLVDTIADGNRLKRLFIPEGQVVTVDDVVIVHTDMVKYRATIKCYPDASGNNVYEWNEDADETS